MARARQGANPLFGLLGTGVLSPRLTGALEFSGTGVLSPRLTGCSRPAGPVCSRPAGPVCSGFPGTGVPLLRFRLPEFPGKQQTRATGDQDCELAPVEHVEQGLFELLSLDDRVHHFHAVHAERPTHTLQ